MKATGARLVPDHEELVEGQEDLDHDQDDDVPLDAQRALVLQQVHEGLDGARDEVELAVDGELALRQLVLVLEPREQAVSPGSSQSTSGFSPTSTRPTILCCVRSVSPM